MLRFIAVSWAGEAAENNAAAIVGRIERDPRHRWHETAQWLGFRLWTIDDHHPAPPIAAGSTTALVGRLFPRDPSSRTITTGPLPDVNDNASPAWIGKHYWGNYVLFLAQPGRLTVLRDPSGAVPCHFHDLNGVRLWFSDINDVVRLFGFNFEVDRDYLPGAFAFPKLAKNGTALIGVGAVLPATALISVDGAAFDQSFFWHPKTFYGDLVVDLDEAIALLRDAVGEVVDAYAAYFRRPVVSIGGLDSSIIWTVMGARDTPNRRGLSLHSRSQKGDERRYVETLPDLGRIDFAEMDGDRIDPDAVFFPAASPCPPGHVDLIELSIDRARARSLDHADAIIYGVGGDNVFLQGADIFPMLDRARLSGVRPSFWRTAMESARYSRSWVGSVAFVGLRESLVRDAAIPVALHHLFGRMSRSGIAPGLLSGVTAERCLHPLYFEDEAVTKGKAFQVLSSCFCATEYYNVHDPAAGIERCELLLSQPIVEACLRIPSWLLAYRGINRGLARMAFAKELPEAVVKRTSKSTPEDVYDDFVRRHRDRISAFLMDGWLVGNGIFDPDSLRKLFDGDGESDASFSHPIVQLVGWEAWARNWR